MDTIEVRGPALTAGTTKPKRQPAVFRKLSVEDSVSPAAIDRILQDAPKDPAQIEAFVLTRMHYPTDALPRLRTRVARWERSPNPRMPSHIKVMATVINIIDRATAKAAAEGSKGLVERAKDRVVGLVSEAKAAMA